VPINYFREFFQKESSSGVVLLCAAILAMVIVNSPAGALYEYLLGLPIGVRAGPLGLEKPLLLWVNDGLMAVFFFLVGLEIKREVLTGELRTLPQAALPAIAALGGMIGPAIVYGLVNLSHPDNLSGWAVPTATDIAFATGVLALLGSRVPPSLRIFLLALAILDDLGAIIVIAIFYTEELSSLSLLLAASGFVTLILFNRWGVNRLAAYVLVAIFMWVCVLESGVHATLAGSMAALCVPLRPKKPGGPSLLSQCEAGLHPWVVFAIMPIFAFANAGLSFEGFGPSQLAHPVTLGIALGLFLGKQIGVLLAVWIAGAMGISRLPAGSTWLQVHAIAVLTGIGFTMSLFIGSLAFDDLQDLSRVRLGVMTASLVSAVVGYVLLARTTRPRISAAT
jgi:NhaA family Na+:H+ antiporter